MQALYRVEDVLPIAREAYTHWRTERDKLLGETLEQIFLEGAEKPRERASLFKPLPPKERYSYPELQQAFKDGWIPGDHVMRLRIKYFHDTPVVKSAKAVARIISTCINSPVQLIALDEREIAAIWRNTNGDSSWHEKFVETVKES